MKNSVILFGMLTEKVGSNLIEVADVNDSDALLKKILEAYPALHDCRFQMAINKKIISNNQAISDQDEIALLPPFAGG